MIVIKLGHFAEYLLVNLFRVHQIGLKFASEQIFEVCISILILLLFPLSLFFLNELGLIYFLTENIFKFDHSINDPPG